MYSLTAAHPYLPARESILPFFEQEHQARRSRPEVSINDLFVHLHGMLFTKIQLDDFDSELARFMEKLTEDRFLSEKQGRVPPGSARPSSDIIAQSTMSNASWVMMGTVNLCAILQYGLEDGVIRAAQQSGHKSHDHSRQKGISKAAGGSAKPTTIAPQAILLSNPNAHAEQRKRAHSISSQEGVPSADNGVDLSPESVQPDHSSSVTGNPDYFDEEHKAIMIKRAEVNDADEGNDPIVFIWAAKFTFEIFKEVLQHDRSGEVCPYLTIILTFLASVCQNSRAMKKLERFIPWDRLVTYFNQIPKSVQIRGPSSLSAQDISTSSNFRLGGVPLFEDWCLRGMNWAGKGLFGRGYWRQQKSNSGNGVTPAESIGESERPIFTANRATIDSEFDALVYLNGELELGLSEANEFTQPRPALGRIDREDEEPEPRADARCPSSADRWRRVGIVASWFSASVPGIKYESDRSMFTVSQSLRQKISRWEDESKREEEERQLLKSKKKGAHHQIAQFDEEIDSQIEEDGEEEDDDDPDDSELVKSLKVRDSPHIARTSKHTF
jgi:hypothetical protein